MDDFCGEPFWDFDSIWATTDPDFTLCFKITVLIWVPCIFLWVLSPLDIYYMKVSKYAKIPWGFLNIFKFIIIGMLIGISAIDLGFAASNQGNRPIYDAFIVAACIKIITFIYAAILTYFHKVKGIQSSGLLFLFWFLLCVCGIPQYRSEIRNAPDLVFDGGEFIWQEFQFVSYMIYFPLTIFILIASCFADKEPTVKNVPPAKKPNPELKSSFVRQLFFQYFDIVVWRGYRKPLETDDMYDINPDDATNEIVPRFDQCWLDNVKKNQNKKKKQEQKDLKFDGKKAEASQSEDRNIRQTNGSILIPMAIAFGRPFWFAGFLKLIMDLLSFASPQLLSLLITFTHSDEAMWKGFLYAFLLFALSLLTSLLNGQYFYRSFLVGFRIRSALISAIYRKAMKISSYSKKSTTVGEIVNLMAVDAQRFFELMAYLHILWSGPLVIALALYFLWQILGPSVLSGLAVMILLIPLNGFIAAKMKGYQVKQMEKKDERVKLMNEILNGIKVLKLYAWEKSFEMTVQDVRDIEMHIIKKMAYYNAGTYFLWTMAPFLVSLASFATFVMVDENNVLDANVAFVSISLFNILRFPMIMFPMMITFIMQAWVSIVRINKFMNNEELDPNSVTSDKNPNALLIENGTFSWGEKPLLNNINVKIPKGELVAIVGPVGTGKSSILSAILGEMEKLQGRVNLDGTIAYVAQQAWIQNSTVQDNILFGKEFNKPFYDAVIEACALVPDLKMLPGGDQTEIGEKGINLSGGQKQRISLARAVYNNAEVYLLDDPLSAVDSHVGKHLFDKVIGPNGLLAGKTVILVTHGISYLPKVSNIFVMLNGEITESGPYSKLIEQKGAFSEFILQHLQEMDDDDEELNEIKEVLSGKPLFERAISLRSSNSEKKNEILANGKKSAGSIRSDNSRSSAKKKELKETLEIPPTAEANKLIQMEDSATGSVNLGVYIRYFKSIGLVFMGITILASIANQGLSVYSNTWLSDWAADYNNTQPAVRDRYLGVYGALGVGQAITLFASSIVLALGCLNAARDLHNRLLGHSFRLPMSFFDTTPLGRIMNRFSKDIDMVDNTLPMSIRGWILMFFTVCAIFVVISISTPIFMAVIVPIAILYYFIQKFYVETSRQLKRIESVTRSPIYSHFGESLTGQSTIRAYDAQARFIEDSTNKVDFNQKCTYPSIIANRWLGVRLEIVGSLVILFAALFAVLGRDTLSGAVVGLSISYALQITQVLSFLVRMTAEVETNIVAIERIEEYSELQTEAALVTKKMDPEWPQNGEVKFNEFKVRYREGLDLVLKGLSFSVKGGEKVGIVGRTGAGKSSLTLSLFRLIEAADGKIIIDGENIAEMGLHSLRSRLTIIPQDPVLFSGTLRMNIDPFNAYTDDDIWMTLQHAHLKAYVKGLNDGLQHMVAEGGENLSVGQRQLVCLARALLRKTKILILDEATAAVDLETDDLIQKTIRSQFADCTILTIAHRLNTIMDSDRIIVLDQGYVAEYDSPANLLQNKNSIFYGMAKSSGLV